MNITDQEIKNVVLVHGAFADGSGWRGVYRDLTDRGYRVTIVQNPLTSFDDDVAATRRVLDQQDGPAILVGHSWGGTVITEAGTHENVAGLVYARMARAIGFLRRHQLTLLRVGGIAMVLVGLLLVTGLWTSLTADLRQTFASFVPVI